MPNPIASLTTRRLLAEAITPVHLANLSSLHSNPLVMKTLSADGKPHREEAIRGILEENIAHWRALGFGLWVFRRKSDDQFIGRGGLKTYVIENREVVGLAYAVMPAFWNRGFATEMAEASLDVGFNYLGLPQVHSWTLLTNLASQRVMDKLGFHYSHDFTHATLPHRCYRLSADDWQQRQ